MSEDPTPPTESSCQGACLFCHLLSDLEKNTIPSRSPSWKLLLNNFVCSLALRLMIPFILSPRPASVPANFPVVCTRRPPHFPAPSLGLIDLVRSSSPLLLFPSKHNEPPAPASLLRSPSVDRHNTPPRSMLDGQLLLEVFAAYSDFPFGGTITIDDGRTCNCIYTRTEGWWDPDADFHSRKKKWLTRHAYSSKFKNELRLSGPGDAISAFCGFRIIVYIPAKDVYHSMDQEYIACYDSPRDFSSTYGDPRTTTITTYMGSLYVSWALLSNSVRADLEVKVRLPVEFILAEVHGHVRVYIGTFEIGTTIFSRDDHEREECPFTDDQDGFGTEFCLPLDRSSLVVPIGSCLHIKGELTLTAWETISINHSIPAESHFFETEWDEDGELEIQTAVCLTLRDVRI